MAEPEKLIWTYVGRRFVKGSTLRHCFVELEDSDTLRWLNKISQAKFKGCVIGTEYEIGDHLPSYWAHAQTGRSAPDSDCIKWQAQDRATEMAQRQKAVKTSPHLDSVVADLKNHRVQLSPVQKAGFDAWLLNAIR